MPCLHLVRGGFEVIFEDSTHWYLTDSCFCSWSTRVSPQLLPRVVDQLFSLDTSFPSLIRSIACFTSFLEFFYHLLHRFTTNLEFFCNDWITLALFMKFYNCISIYYLVKQRKLTQRKRKQSSTRNYTRHSKMSRTKLRMQGSGSEALRTSNFTSSVSANFHLARISRC
jgi:hypothetical protein